jgi:hypothetical protein
MGTVACEGDSHGYCQPCFEATMKENGFGYCERCCDWKSGVMRVGHYQLCPDHRLEARDDAEKMVK